jgi:hypothetical protein
VAASEAAAASAAAAGAAASEAAAASAAAIGNKTGAAGKIPAALLDCQKRPQASFGRGAAVCRAHKLRGVGRAISTLAACKELFPTYTPPEKADLHLICACGRKLCEAFDKQKGARESFPRDYAFMRNFSRCNREITAARYTKARIKFAAVKRGHT